MKTFKVVIETPEMKRQFVTLVEVQDDQTDGDAITIARQEWPTEFKVVSSELVPAPAAPEIVEEKKEEGEEGAGSGESTEAGKENQ